MTAKIKAKPLVWNRFDEARLAHMQYAIRKDDAGKWECRFFFVNHIWDKSPGTHLTLEAARAACQLHADKLVQEIAEIEHG